MIIDLEKVKRLQEKYKAIPKELQFMKRWVGFKIEDVVDKDGKVRKNTKVPYNAITGNKAQSNNSNTWTSFDIAIKGCIAYRFNGIGFMLGDGIFGIDLDNHADPITNKFHMTDEQFKEFSNEFINELNSYAEYSPSGLGVHIICKGHLPEGRRRNDKIFNDTVHSVEMYDKYRFFTITGNVINNAPVNECSEKVIPLWKKYVDDSEEIKRMRAITTTTSPYDFTGQYISPNRKITNFNDEEIIKMACSAKNGSEFEALYNGDMSKYLNDHSKADMAFCTYLAFWCNCNASQMDRIFRASKLMREKWDEMRGAQTYGNMCISKAIQQAGEGYQGKYTQEYQATPPTPLKPQYKPTETNKEVNNAYQSSAYMTIDENGEPIFRIKQTFKEYPFTDIGNAERFYDYFGDLFKYNKDNQKFMYWTGKLWQEDKKDIIRKYANKLVDIMKSNLQRYLDAANKFIAEGDDEEAKKQKAIYVEAQKNITRISNKAGMDAMLYIFQSIHNIPVLSEDFDKDIYSLNTDSGIVNLLDGTISNFDRQKMLSNSTHCLVSYDTPKTWLNFLSSIFWRGASDQEKKESQEIIDCVQQIMGLSLTGSTREQVMYILYGKGSNGKSTFLNVASGIMGDYAKSLDSSILMTKAGQNTSAQYSLAELVGCRLLITSETDEGEQLSEKLIKTMTGSDSINAQRKYGRPFEFLPQFKVFMMTNNLPIIRGTDYGIWRRIFLIPFLRKFAEKDKDLDMPEKLKAEYPQILGWCIKGYIKYCENGRRIQMPECLSRSLKGYREDMDVVARFLNKVCNIDNKYDLISAPKLYNQYKKWALDNNEFRMRESKFAENLATKGFNQEKTSTGDYMYRGISIKASVESENYSNYAYHTED